MDLIGAVKDLASKRAKHNDDLFIDRLNHKYTVGIIVFFAAVITVSQYSGRPINCWAPGHFNGNYESYAEDICWVSSTYNIPIDEDLPHQEEDRKEKMLKYYQWTPFILLLMAMFFFFPRMIWRSLNDKSGLNMQLITDAVYNQAADREGLLTYVTNNFDHYVNSNKKPKELRDLYYDQLGNSNYTEDHVHFRKRKNVYIDKKAYINKNIHNKKDSDNDSDDYDDEIEQYLKNSQPKKGVAKIKASLGNFWRTCCITKGKRKGNFLTALFLAVRVMYTVNSIFQLFLLNILLGNSYWLLGFEVMEKVWYGEDWAQLKRFPRVTMCDFKIREVGIVHRYTVQCVLSINLFNEKIFIFLWFWLCIVSFMNIFDLIGWVHSLIVNSHERYAYVRQRLYSTNNSPKNKKVFLTNPDNKKLFKKFVNHYLKEDGVLALRFLSRNSNDLVVSEVIGKLFDSYKESQLKLKEIKKKKKERLSPENIDQVNDENIPPFVVPNIVIPANVPDIEASFLINETSH